MDNLGYFDSDSDNDTHNVSEDSHASDEWIPDIDRLLLNPSLPVNTVFVIINNLLMVIFLAMTLSAQRNVAQKIHLWQQ
jgi:hypothetical protein